MVSQELPTTNDFLETSKTCDVKVILAKKISFDEDRDKYIHKQYIRIYIYMYVRSFCVSSPSKYTKCLKFPRRSRPGDSMELSDLADFCTRDS